MGIAAGLAAAAAGASLGSTISNAVGGSGGSGGYYGGSSPPPAYIPTQQPAADAAYFNLANQFSNEASYLPGLVLPGLTTATNLLTNNPWASYAQSGANAAGYYAPTLAGMETGAASSLQGLGKMAAGYAPELLATGFDPQQALYQQNYGQTQDQANAINAMYGLGSSPAGAGLTQNALQNFNTNWQNQQLQRQATAAQGYGSLTNTAGQAYSGAGNLGQAGYNTYAQGYGAPYNTYQAQQQNNIAALNGLTSGATSAYGLDQNALNALAAYLKLGQSATSVGQAGANQQAGLNTQLGQNIGASLNALSPALASLFGPSNPQTGYGTATNSGYAGTDNLSGLYDPSNVAGSGASYSGGFY